MLKLFNELWSLAECYNIAWLYKTSCRFVYLRIIVIILSFFVSIKNNIFKKIKKGENWWQLSLGQLQESLTKKSLNNVNVVGEVQRFP